jgi:hypothetical protein
MAGTALADPQFTTTLDAVPVRCGICHGSGGCRFGFRERTACTIETTIRG